MKAAEYVHPTIAYDAEVSIFILSSEENAKYTFWGEGGDYKDERASHALPGDAYDLSGRLVARKDETVNLPSDVYICNGRKFIKD